GFARCSSSWDENPKRVTVRAAAREDFPDSLGPMMRFSRLGSNAASNPATGPNPSIWTRSNRMAWILELREPEPERERHGFLLLPRVGLGQAIQGPAHEGAPDGGLVLELTQEGGVHEVGAVIQLQMEEAIADRAPDAIGLEGEIGGALQADLDDLALAGEG